MLNEKLIKSGLTVAVAASGGKDSMCLLDLLAKNADRLGITVKAVNVEHGIRGENSVADSEFVAKICEERHIDLFFRKVDCPSYARENGLSAEEAARALRYKCFDEAIDSGFCDVIATAHHASDNAETVLFNLLRGAAAGGVKGIGETARCGRIIRPLLFATRQQIDAYIAENGLSYVTDESNDDTAYTRNFLRKEVIPLIKTRFPEAEGAIARFAETAAEDDAFLSGLAQKALRFANETYSVSDDLPNAVFARACVLALKGLGLVKDYEKRHIDSLIALRSARNGTEIHLPLGIRAVHDYGKVTLYKPAEKRSFAPVGFAEGEYSFGEKVYLIDRYTGGADEAAALAKAGKGLYFDRDKIPADAVIRTREEGDLFTKFGGATKKLKDYFIDKKIPARERDGFLVAASGKKILLIFGMAVSDLIKVDKSTRNVLKCIGRDE